MLSHMEFAALFCFNLKWFIVTSHSHLVNAAVASHVNWCWRWRLLSSSASLWQDMPWLNNTSVLAKHPPYFYSERKSVTFCPCYSSSIQKAALQISCPCLSYDWKRVWNVCSPTLLFFPLSIRATLITDYPGACVRSQGQMCSDALRLSTSSNQRSLIPYVLKKKSLVWRAANRLEIAK